MRAPGLVWFHVSICQSKYVMFLNAARLGGEQWAESGQTEDLFCHLLVTAAINTLLFSTRRQVDTTGDQLISIIIGSLHLAANVEFWSENNV